MRVRLVYIQSSKEPWAELAENLYSRKLAAFCQFETLALKAKSHGRSDHQKKKSEESKLLISKIEPRDFNVLFDEAGQLFDSTLIFAEKIRQLTESYRSISFSIGGAYGVDEEAKGHFHQAWSLSHLTVNHHLAKIIAMEQIYRAFTVLKGIPYHNE